MAEHADRVEDLVAYVLFDVDPRVQAAQRPLFSFLVSLVLYRSTEALDVAGIHTEVLKLLPTGKGVTVDQVRGACRTNTEQGLLEVNARSRYQLSEHRHDQLGKADKALQSRKSAFHEHMAAAIEALELGLSAKDLHDELEEHLQSLMQAHSAMVASVWVGSGKGFDESLGAIDTKPHLQLVANRLVPGPSRGNVERSVVVEALSDALVALPQDGADYLAAVYQRTVALALLAQDPRIQSLKGNLASRRLVYLDTNVLVAAMCTAHPRHDEAMSVLETTQAVGANLCVTEFTVDELTGQIRNADDWYRKYTGAHEALAFVDDPYVRSFRIQQVGSPGLEWNHFMAEFKPPESWLSDRGIAIDADSKGALDHSGIGVLEQCIRAAKSKKDIPPTVNSVRIDALNLIQVDRLRSTNGPDEMGSKVWLVTLDTNLKKAQRNWSQEGGPNRPLSIDAAEWSGLMGPCIPPDQSALRNYAASLVKSEFGLVATDPELVGKDFLLTLTKCNFELGTIFTKSPETARRILSQLQSQEEFRRLIEEPELDDTKWRNDFETEIERAVKEIRELPEVKAERLRDKRATASVKRQLEDQKQEKRRALRSLADSKERLEKREDTWGRYIEELQRYEDLPFFKKLFAERPLPPPPD